MLTASVVFSMSKTRAVMFINEVIEVIVKRFYRKTIALPKRLAKWDAIADKLRWCLFLNSLLTIIFLLGPKFLFV